VILGPRNYLGRAWQGAPISITVEGANILTRSLMIFGQGSIRCHPYLLDEMEAANIQDETERLARFDDLIFRHAGYFLSSLVRAPVTALTGGWLTRVPRGTTARHFRRLSRFSAALALASDAALMSLGGALKKRESLSGRLGDVLSQLYIASALLKRFHDQGCPADDRPLLDWAIEDCCRDMEAALAGVCRNFPSRPLGWILRALIFPLGVRARTDNDRLGRRVAGLLMTPGATRDRLTEGIWLEDPENNELAQLDRALSLVLETEPLEERLTDARRDGSLKAGDPEAELAAAEGAGLITAEDAARLREARALVAEIIAVDDFEAEELRAGQSNRDSTSRQVA
jgi:acyl-CoA dehydrogenase